MAIDNYKAAWIALQTAIMQKSQWSARELVDLITLLEAQYGVGLLGEMGREALASAQG